MIRLSEPIGRRKRKKKTGASVVEFAARGTWMEQNFNQMGNEKCDGLFYVTH